VQGFEIESTLGRGGMGVVYKATQTGLNRAVALKMLLAGPFAEPALRARFLLEAESIAALEHPHIIRVFAFGESGGHPYLAMEFVPGGTLAERIRQGGPLPARAATELVAKLAGAVAHAHSRGIVHRDIKPLNVLLTAEGEPRLTDFGLAKVGRADQNLSATGQVLGTPAYMAPEQAAGKVHEVGTAADVYALGAVLYDVLTGRPPFQGDSAVVTIQKVLSEEPRRPRALNAAIPRDLETICLKCLEKDPARRYPTAQALADDLLHHLRGEPISARPAGALERAYKWVKRNRVVTGAGAAVALALVGGAGVALAFGLEAGKQAEEARKQKRAADAAAEREKGEAERADRERNDAIRVRNDLAVKNGELVRAHERVNRALAQALFAPLGSGGLPLSAIERESLWGVAELRRDDVSWMFLLEALGTPLAREQLENRAEYTLHAAIGLDPKRRAAADRLLADRLRDEPDPARSVQLARICARWGACSVPNATRAADLLLAALTRETGAYSRGPLAEPLSAAAVRMDPARGAELLLGALDTETDRFARSFLVNGVLAVAARMDPTRRANVCARATESLIRALGTETFPEVRWELAAKLLPAVVGHTEPARSADLLLGALSRERGRDSMVSGALAEDVSAVAGRMEPDEAAKVLARAAELVLAALGQEPNAGLRRALARALSAVAARMEPPGASKVCGEAAEALLLALARETSADARWDLAEAVAGVVRHLDPVQDLKGSGQLTKALLVELGKETRDYARGALARALSALAARADPAQGSERLMSALNKETASFARAALAEGVAAVSARFEPARANQVCREAAEVLLGALEKETLYDAHLALARGLAALAMRMTPTDARKVCDRAVALLLRALGKETFHEAGAVKGRALAAVVVHADPARSAELLLGEMNKEPSSVVRSALAEGVAVAAARMEPDRATRVCERGAELLLSALVKEPRDDERAALGRALTAVAVRMDPGRAAHTRGRAALIMLDALSRSVGSSRTALVESFSAVVVGRAANERVRRAASATAPAPHNRPAALALAHPDFNPQPRPLPAQDLVELLKHPLCVGEARRAVLDALEDTEQCTFADVWEFVAYAQKHQSQLDLLTPPMRPQQP
jgi:hypothetical protein